MPTCDCAALVNRSLPIPDLDEGAFARPTVAEPKPRPLCEAQSRCLRYPKSWTFARRSGMIDGAARNNGRGFGPSEAAVARNLLGVGGERLTILAATALLLAGCATTRYQTVYCISHDQALPAEPPKIKSELNGQADHDTQIIAGSAIRLRSWGEGLATILEGCREPNTGTPPE